MSEVFDRIKAVISFREELEESIAAGRLDLEAIFVACERDPVVADTKILGLIEALPGVGKVKARRALDASDIGLAHLVGGLSKTQRAALVSHLSPTRTSSLVIVVSGPGGVGKGTVVRELVGNDPGLLLSQSWTTRPARPSENAESYNFVSEQQFRTLLDADGFLEWNHFRGVAYYGSPMPEPAETRDLVLEIDVNGARQIVDRIEEPLLIFVDTPSVDEQQRRLVGRGDTKEQVEQRMMLGEAERKAARDLPYEYVVNDDISRAAQEMSQIVSARRIARRQRG